jgi:hypothetical protein
MDIDYFLKNRTKFIRFFYEQATAPFIVIISAIENEEEPFVPPYSEDPEPPFLEEWLEANTGMETIGHTALSMLSSSLQLFFKEWVHRLKTDHGMDFQVNFKNKGWFNGYRKILEEIEMPMNECPADLEIIEQVALARNRVQHPEEITTLNVRHSESDLRKYPYPYFAQEHEIRLAGADEDGAISWWLKPSVATTKEKVFQAVSEVESLCTWLEEEYWKARNA